MADEKGSAAAVWRSACEYIRRQSEDAFKQWFEKIVPLSLEDGVMELGVPDSFYSQWLETNYGDLLRQALESAGASSCKVSFAYGYQPEDTGLDVPEYPTANSRAEQPADSKASGVSFSAENTFENFVVGEENRYAYFASTTAAKNPGQLNPLYIYGGPGMGKTHLLQAIAHDVLKRNPRARVRYTSCEGFLNDYVASMRDKNNYGFFEFRERYRNVDYLLIDDVHHLGNKTALQEEFFNTFNALHGAGRQIVLTSDKQPSEIPGLEARLVSRFESGVATQITQPSFETRLAILKQEQEHQALKLADSVLEFIATRITSNIRPLKSALLRLTIYSTALKRQIDIGTAEEVLSDLLNKEAETRVVSIETIQKVVAEHFGLQVQDLTGPKRPKNIAEARMFAMYLSRKLTGHSHKEVGHAFGNRNHATVIHAVQQTEEMMLKDEETKRLLNTLQRKIQIR